MKRLRHGLTGWALLAGLMAACVPDSDLAGAGRSGAPASVAGGVSAAMTGTGASGPTDPHTFEPAPAPGEGDGFDAGDFDALGADPTVDGSLGPPRGPASLGPVRLAIIADCVRIAVAASRPVDATVVFTVDGITQSFPFGKGATLFDNAFRPERAPATDRGDAPDATSTATVAVTATDSEGNVVTSAPVSFEPPPPAGALVITEVLANPVGAETAQEFVELANLGSEPVSTEGLHVEDAKGMDQLPPALIPPGGRALIVGASFDESGATDVPPRAGTILLHVTGRIGRDGLGQTGELVRLVGPGTLVRSVYGGWVDVHGSTWPGHSVHRLPNPAACDHPRAWTQSPLPATPGW